MSRLPPSAAQQPESASIRSSLRLTMIYVGPFLTPVYGRRATAIDSGSTARRLSRECGSSGDSIEMFRFVTVTIPPMNHPRRYSSLRTRADSRRLSHQIDPALFALAALTAIYV